MIPFSEILWLDILFVLYSIVEGYRVAHWENASEKTYLVTTKMELQDSFVVQRAIMFTLILTCVFVTTHDLFLCILYLISMLCIFPFFHDGVFYTVRHMLSEKLYPKAWWSDPIKESTHFFDKFLTSQIRTILALTGFLMQVFFIQR